MDEKPFESVKPNDSLPSADSVHRIALQSDRETDENGNYIPKYTCFSLTPADTKDNYKLSVEWDKKTTPEETLIRLGTSFRIGKRSNEYKPYDNRLIYKIEVAFLRKLPFILDVIYSPSIKNDAHSSICFNKESYNFEENRPQMLIEIRDHAKQFTVEVNMAEVQKKVEEIRQAAQKSN